MSRVHVQQGQRAVVRKDARVVAVLDAGRHKRPRPWWRVRVDHVDVRERLLVITGQEVATADAPGVKLSAVARWSVSEPVAFLDVSSDPVEELRLQVQLAVRDWAATRAVDSLGPDRAAAAESLTAQVVQAVERVGVRVHEVAVRDVVLPGELRRAALAVLTARQEGLVALERARAETAALRAMANGARVLEDHPALLQLRAAATAGDNGGTVVVTLPAPTA